MKCIHYNSIYLLYVVSIFNSKRLTLNPIKLVYLQICIHVIIHLSSIYTHIENFILVYLFIYLFTISLHYSIYLYTQPTINIYHTYKKYTYADTYNLLISFDVHISSTICKYLYMFLSIYLTDVYKLIWI